MLKSWITLVILFAVIMSPANAWRRRRRRSCDSSSCSWQWGSCTKTCGGGLKYPQVTKPQGSCGSCNLPSPASCNTQCCLINCVWGEWSDFGACSTTCGCGNQTRIRSALVHESCGGKKCEGQSTESRLCNADPVDCKWGPWGEYGTCSATCGDGEQARYRQIIVPDVCGGSTCSGSSTESIPCNINCCPVDCIWEPWGEFGSCSVSCGTGTRSRVRNIEIGVRGGGEACSGPITETVTCTNQTCERHCDWLPWSNWTECSASCGGGFQSRSRSLEPTDDCNEIASETRNCNDNCCAVDCEWDPWSHWSTCTKSCNAGTRVRQRGHGVAPACGGKSCEGNFIEEEVCNDVCCPRDCIWSDWTLWSSCSKSCDSGTQTRHRNMSHPQECGGNSCLGTSVEEEACNGHECSVDCEMSEWTEWSSCSSTCGPSGASARTRQVVVYPSFHGTPCPELMLQSKPCSRVCLNGGNLTDTECSCIAGWYGGCCDLDVDECAGGSYSCKDHATCFNTMGSFHCQCNGGFKQDTNGNCVDIDECSLANHGCTGDHMTCVNKQGGYTCECAGSFEMIDGICLEIEGYCEISQWQHWSSCSATCGTSGVSVRHRYVEPTCGGATCNNNTEEIQECNRICFNGGNLSDTTCTCPEGWTDGCCETDIDECQTTEGSTSLCADNAICKNIVGGFICYCDEGFTGDGYTYCSSSNGCSVEGSTSLCAKHAYCASTPAGHVCLCERGFTGIGDSYCDDIDECTDDPHICSKATPTCTNIAGGFLCT